MFWNIYKDLCDTWSIYYNSDEIFEKIATNDKILDNQKYEIFYKDIECT